MSEREITCDGCENTFTLPEGFEDPTALCPFCSKIIELSNRMATDENGEPQQRKLKVKLQKSPDQDDRYKQCPSCSKSWGLDMVICANCGYNWEKNQSQTSLMRNGWVLIVLLVAVIAVLAYFVFK